MPWAGRWRSAARSPPAELVEAGLATPRKGGNGVYDRFRARVIFPIRDATGNATGLGGRVLKGATGADPEGPKYLNSPATPMFDKSRTLYLLDRAKAQIRKTGTAVIVEGYTDALMAHQAGFTNVVASLGTALTPGQVALLIRYAAKKIVLAYDVDPAGEKAGTLGVTALEGLTRQLAASDTDVELDEVRVARLPDGKDPDEVIRDSPDAWREAIRTALPIVEYLIDFHARGADLRTTGGRARFVDAILPTLRTVRNPVLRDGYLQTLRQVSGVEERVLLEALHRAPDGGAAAGAREPAPAGRTAAGSPPTRSWRRRTPSTPGPSCARSARSSASCSGSCCWPPSSRSRRRSAWRPPTCRRRRPASCGPRSSPSARRGRTRRRPSTPAWIPRRRPSWRRSWAGPS